MFKNNLLKVLTISILISSLFLTSCTTEEKTITVQDDMQKMSNELDEDGMIFTKVRDLDIPEINGASIISVANDSSPVFFRQLLKDSNELYDDLFTLNSDNSINLIENLSVNMYKDFSNSLITYFKGTELWSYDINKKEKSLIINLPDIKADLSTYPHKLYGKNDYVSILSFTPSRDTYKSIIRIIDLKTGNVYSSPLMEDQGISPEIFYSEITNKFYTASITSQNIVEFSLDNMIPRNILDISKMGSYNFKLSDKGDCIYLPQRNTSNGELYLSKFDLLTRKDTPLLKVSPKEDTDKLSWINFYTTDTTIVYAFTYDASSYSSKLYCANISEDSLTNTQLLYSSIYGEKTNLWFHLSEDGSKLITAKYTSQTSEQDKVDKSAITTNYSLYEKTK